MQVGMPSHRFLVDVRISQPEIPVRYDKLRGTIFEYHCLMSGSPEHHQGHVDSTAPLDQRARLQSVSMHQSHDSRQRRIIVLSIAPHSRAINRGRADSRLLFAYRDQLQRRYADNRCKLLLHGDDIGERPPLDGDAGDEAFLVDRHVVHAGDLDVTDTDTEHHRGSLAAADDRCGRKLVDVGQQQPEHVDHGILADKRLGDERAQRYDFVREMLGKSVSLSRVHGGEVRAYMGGVHTMSPSKRNIAPRRLPL